MKKLLMAGILALAIIPVAVVLTACGIATPTGLARNADNGNLTWNHVSDAEFYVIRVVGAGHTVYVIAEVGGTGEAANMTIAMDVVTVTGGEFTRALNAELADMVDWDDLTQAQADAFLAATSWSIRVAAMDGTSKSGWSNTVTFNPNA